MTDPTPEERPFNFTRLWTQIEQEAMRGLISYMTRREFMKAMGAGAIVAALPSVLPRVVGRLSQFMTPASAQDTAETAQTAPGLPNGIAAGDVSQDSAVLWARTDTPGIMHFSFRLADNSHESSTMTFDITDPMQPVKWHIDGLQPDTAYTYEIRAPGQDTGLNGTFTTAAPPGEKRGLRFGVSGDWRGELRPYVALENVTAHDLAFFVVLGDTIYADYPSEAVPTEQCITLDDFRRKHAEVYSPQLGRNLWPELRAAIPFYACIDDHEVTNDFAGAALPSTMPEFADDPAEMISQTALYRNGLQAFNEYHPIADEIWENTGDPRFDGRPKLYRYRTFGSDAAMIMVDARSFRDAAVAELPLLSIFDEEARRAFLAKFWEPGRTMLGRPQVEALKADLLKAQAGGLTWKFILLPEPAQLTGWLGGFDRWEGYAPERTEVLQFIEDNGITNVVIIAADIHTTFITGLNYQTEPNGPLIPSSVLEITTGSVAFWPPTGQALVEGAAQFRLIFGDELAGYRTGTIQEKDALLVKVYDRFVSDLQGYAPISLDGTNAELLEGSLIAGHSFGWTAFDIDAETQQLTVTTYGIRAYDLAALTSDPDEVLSRTPQVLSVVKVRAV